MKLEELQRVSLTAKHPDEDMTDKYWQEYFKVMKALTRQSIRKTMKYSTVSTIVNGQAERESEYKGETQWNRYVGFINGILAAIRLGEVDYCFYIYQIADLLKYEHDNLRTEWLPDEKCFKVWLKK